MTALDRHSAGAMAPEVSVAYETELGAVFRGKVEDFLDLQGKKLKGKVQLVFFSPPFPLKRKKKYGNKDGDEYLAWLQKLAPRLADLLTEDGSLVVEIGNAWDPGKPTMSLLPLQSLMAIAEGGDLNICQQFVCNNPARLPTPAQWVNIERIRVKDSYTHLWWMSKSERPKASNRNVLQDYSPSMQALLKRGHYNHGTRDSGYDIGETSFLTNNGGAIPSNVFNFSNTVANDAYRRYCREHGLKPHPAPMQAKLADWFIRFLTDKDDLVFDPFGGSNTTGAMAEQLGRRWLAVEPLADYIAGSKGRFEQFHSRPPITRR
ncbi:DNA-methyltransferase [Jiangella alba]|uniref:DNA-methyltransferase n=1 Tax=Jiangella alba TaxID=561176 RepID=UPI00159FA43D|nr:site-specific DNA-methyltransferase [Jiangella alba]